ncbi:HEAT repeat domain-containing protein [Lysobacter korlensis]|uniref:HEAT repeat domain-containing protein n=1 Tax=Lysobacter korlensis TaxID=553636 RepID=A0ABV6S1I2_9GAMM
MTAAHSLRLSMLLVLGGCTAATPAPVATEIPPATAVVSPATKTPAVPETCVDLDACVKRLRFLALRADEYNSLDASDQALIERMSTVKGATARLVSLLADPDKDVAELAAAALSNTPNIDPVYLPQVKAGLDRKLGWLPRALGRMDSDEAAREAVARFLVSEDAPANQENFAVKLSGRRALPWIVKHARCKPACGENDIYLLAAALKEMGNERGEAAPALMDIAESPSSSTTVAQGALQLVAALEKDGLAAEARLVALSRTRPELKHSVDLALIGTHSELAGDILASSLGPESDPVALRDVAVLGRAGRSAGPKVVELLHAPDWELRIAAATALGEIGYEPAIPLLAKVAQDPTDVRLQWVAVRALGRLRAIDARPELARLARDHWYPPVREAAVAALEELALPPAAPDADNAERRAIDRFWSWSHMGSTAAECERVTVESREMPGTLDGSTDSERIQLMSLAYPKLARYAPPPPPPEPGLRPTERAKAPTTEMTVPDVALRLDDGWLVGTSEGEWGGDLVFVQDGNRTKVIATHNVTGIHRLGSRVVVLSGLAHLTANRGAAFELVRKDKDWRLQPWRGLPAAPLGNSMTASGELLVQTAGGGTLLIAPNGTMRMAPCSR